MIFDWFAKWAVYNPDKVAFREYETDRTYTYRTINMLANATASWFMHDLKLKKGDRIAVLAENCLEYVVLFAVTQKTGLTLVPLNYRLAPRELDFMLSDSAPTVVFIEEQFREKLENSESRKEITHWLPLNDLKEKHASFLKEYRDFEFENVEFEEDHPAYLIYTSGTTAFPKGAIYSHKMLFWNSINTEIRLDIVSSDRALNCAPPFHTGSWNVLQNPFILHGGYTLLMRSFDPDAVLEQLEKDKHTIFWGVPTMVKFMAESKAFEKADLSRIRYFVLGGEAMPIPLIKKYHDKGVPIRQGYGLTEVGPNVYSLDESDAMRKQGSIGTPNFFYEVLLVDQEGKPIAGEGVGELLLKGPAVTPGYWNNPEATKESIIDGWFHTGDLVRRDSEGYYYVVDRIKNMYISGGENVYPTEVEHFLQTMEGIHDVAIIGVADEKWGETGKAFIAREKGSSVTKKEITAFCRKNLAKYKIPKHIEFIEQLPVNNAGKIDRKKLKEEGSDG